MGEIQESGAERKISSLSSITGAGFRRVTSSPSSPNWPPEGMMSFLWVRSQYRPVETFHSGNFLGEQALWNLVWTGSLSLAQRH